MITPNPPTDNLYKFVSVFGLALIAMGIYSYNQAHKELGDSLSAFAKAFESVNSQIAAKQMREQTLEVAQQQLEDKEFIETFYKHLDQDNDLDDASAEKEYSRIRMAVAKFRFTEIRVYSYWLIGTGIVISGLGFVFWYRRHQRFQDALLRIEHLAAMQKNPPTTVPNKSTPKNPPNAAGKPKK